MVKINRDSEVFYGSKFEMTNLQLCRAQRSIVRIQQNICRTEDSNLTKGIILDKMNEAFDRVFEKYKFCLN